MKNIKNATLLLFALFSIVTASMAGQAPISSKLTSPDGRLRANITLEQGNISYSLNYQGKPLLKRSALGLQIDKEPENAAWAIKNVRSRPSDTNWKPVWGKREKVRDHYNELTVSLTRNSPLLSRMDIIFRAYNDGLAFRYALAPDTPPLTDKTKEKALTVTADLSEFAFATDGQAWSYNGENRPRGPESLASIKETRRCPLTIKLAPDRHAAILEAALYDFAWLELTSQPANPTLRAKVGKSTVALPFQTPWRVIQVGEKPGDLVDSDLLANLNPPNKITDAKDWIKPGVAFWDWRAWGYKTDDGFTYGLDLPSWKRFVDLASEAGVPYLLLDADWYGPEFDKTSDPVKGGKVRDVQEIIRYGKEKNVALLLYLNDAGTKNNSLEAILKSYSEWGAAGIKYGFMRGTGQEKVNKTRHIIELCAKYHLTCDFHDGPVPPTGDERTWPNCLAREFCHSQSDSKRAFTPETYCLQVYVNMLGGPLDMCNGLFDMNKSLKQRPKIFAQLNSTITANAARTLITYSGLSVLPDTADQYRKHPELFAFIAGQKQPWAQSRTLAGEMGDSIVMARKSAEGNWLLAACTDEQAREIEVSLDFLDKGKYAAVICEDTPETHYKTNREAYRVRKTHLTKRDSIKIKMAPGGGFCLTLTPQK